MRSKKAVLNGLISLAFEVVTIISGFLIPRLILRSFGSDYNGITQTITQFIGYISLITVGVSSVTMAALYIPLANNDIGRVSAIIKATKNFMERVCVVFVVVLVLFSLIFPLFVLDEFGYVFSFTLSLILGIGIFANNYFGLTYVTLLGAHQKLYIRKVFQIIVLTFYTLFSVILLKAHASLHLVKIVGSLIFLLNPLFLNIYVRKKYKLDVRAPADDAAISQKWDAFAHQVANFVHDNTDLIILAVCSNMKEVSVYSVYYLIFFGVKSLIISSITGIEAAFGNMIAKEEKAALAKNLKLYEFFLHSAAIVLYVGMAVLITPFVSLYTTGVTDVNYYRPLFGYLISVIGFFYAVRVPYQAAARAAGHYKQTRNGAIIEAVLNIVVSVALVIPFGMVGLAVGTLAATLFRTVQYGLYVSKAIVKRNIGVIIYRYALSAVNVLAILGTLYFIPLYEVVSFVNWIKNGFIVAGVGMAVTLLFGVLFFKHDLKNMKCFILNLFKRKNHKFARE